MTCVVSEIRETSKFARNYTLSARKLIIWGRALRVMGEGGGRSRWRVASVGGEATRMHGRIVGRVQTSELIDWRWLARRRRIRTANERLPKYRSTPAAPFLYTSIGTNIALCAFLFGCIEVTTIWLTKLYYTHCNFRYYTHIYTVLLYTLWRTLALILYTSSSPPALAHPCTPQYIITPICRISIKIDCFPIGSVR